MTPFGEDRKKELNEAVDELYDLRKGINRKEADINALIGDMNDDIQAYNNVLSNMDALVNRWVSELEDYQKEHKRDWDETDAGKHHKEMMTEWETIFLDPIDQIEEIELDNMKHPDKLGALPVPR